MRATHPIVIHYVHDMAHEQQFYLQVFDVATSFESPGWTTLQFGSFELALHILHPGHDTEAPIPHAGLNLLVDNIEDMAERVLAQGGSLVELREPDDFVPVRVATFQDSEGNGFELRQEVGTRQQ